MFEQIYSLFQLELDGEEFDTDDDALLACNTSLREILADRNWKFLNTSFVLPSDLSFSSLTDIDAPLEVWAENGEYPLSRATFEDRFNTEFDYWVDYANSKIVLINTEYTNATLTLDYKKYPADFTLTTASLSIPQLKAPIAYQMGLTYYRKDQDTSTYSVLQGKFDRAMDLLINYNASL